MDIFTSNTIIPVAATAHERGVIPVAAGAGVIGLRYSVKAYGPS